MNCFFPFCLFSNFQDSFLLKSPRTFLMVSCCNQWHFATFVKMYILSNHDLNWGMRARVYFEMVCPCIPVLDKVQLFFDLLWATAVIPVNIVLCYDSVSVCSDETSPLVDVCFIVDNYRFYCHKVSWVVDTVGGNTLQSLRSTSACKCGASLLTSISSRVIARKLVREPTKKLGARGSCSRLSFSTNSRGKLAVQASAQREFYACAV